MRMSCSHEQRVLRCQSLVLVRHLRLQHASVRYSSLTMT
jgi:hypothetical protein